MEQKLHKQIDDEVKREEEIDEIAQYTARQLAVNPMVPFSIDNRDFLLVAAMYNDNVGNRCIQLVAREKTAILTPNAKIIKANMDIRILIDNKLGNAKLIINEGLKLLRAHIRKVAVLLLIL